MQKQTFRLASLCLLLTLASALVQAQSRITVQVPFNFVASDRTFSAGQYSVSASRDEPPPAGRHRQNALHRDHESGHRTPGRRNRPNRLPLL